MKSITFKSFEKYSIKQSCFVKGGALDTGGGSPISSINMVCFTEGGDDFCIEVGNDSTAYIHGAVCIESSVGCVDIAVVTP